MAGNRQTAAGNSRRKEEGDEVNYVLYVELKSSDSRGFPFAIFAFRVKISAAIKSVTRENIRAGFLYHILSQTDLQYIFKSRKKQKWQKSTRIMKIQVRL